MWEPSLSANERIIGSVDLNNLISGTHGYVRLFAIGGNFEFTHIKNHSNIVIECLVFSA